jgi:1-deoxy-D-xylulose-5-phosphate synthase
VAALGRMDVLYRPGGTGETDVLAGPAGQDVLLLGAGPMAGVCVEAAGKLADQGIGVTVVDPRWLKPLDEALAEAAAGHRLVVTVEDNGRAGGFGDAVGRLLRDAGVDTPMRTFGLPQEFLEHGKREEILADAGLVPQHLARGITEAVARLMPELEHQTPS